MKFPRNVRILRGQLDAAPFACVFFLLLIFVMLGSLGYTPGVQISLPLARTESGGVEGPTIAVAVDKNGQYYFRNQLIGEDELTLQLRSAVSNSPTPLTLVVQEDKETKRESMDRLAAIAEKAGIPIMQLANLPRLYQPDQRAATNAP